MKILIVGQYYYPDNFRINEISYELVRLGNDVTVLTGLPDYSFGKIPNEYKWFKRRKEVINGVNIIRVPVIARRTGAIFRALNYVSFLISSSIRAAFLKKDFDAVFCYQTSPVTMAHAALKMKERLNKKLFLYCLDLWPESLKAWNIREDSAIFRAMCKYSSRIYNNCDIIGITSEPFLDYLTKTHGVDRSKIIYLPQHSDAIGIPPAAERSEGNIRFTYAGNIGKAQDVQCIIRAAGRLREIPCFEVHIFGNGASFEDCKALARELDIMDKICFHGRVNREELMEEYIRTDAFLLTLKEEGFIGMTMPAKLQEYMSAGRPVIAAISGAAAQVIEKSKCGLVSGPSDDAALADNMRKFLFNPGEYKQMGANGYKYYKTNFTLDIFMERLTKILQGLERKEALK